MRIAWTKLAEQVGAKLPPARVAHKPPRALPAQVLAFFGDADSIPQRPKAANDPDDEGMRSCDWAGAVRLRLVELNPPAQVHWLAFDCDHGEHDLWRKMGLPEPSFITINPKNQNHHVVYRLKEPVCRSERGRARPLAFLRAVRGALRAALNGDTSYNGKLTKNPLHPAWITLRQPAMPAYSLAELAAPLDLRTASKAARRQTPWQVNLAEVGIGGRNRALFDAVRRWAYRNRDDLSGVMEYAEQCNALFPQPLDFNEVRDIVNSVVRYLTDRRRAERSNAAFSERQAARGKLGGRPRTTMDTEPWVSAGVSRSTWYAQQVPCVSVRDDSAARPSTVRRGRPPTTKDRQPWVALGISRATWYRRLRM